MNDKIEGRNPVIEALRAGQELNKIMIAEGAKGAPINTIIDLANENRILYERVPKIKLDKMSETNNHQGVIALGAVFKYYELDYILETAKKRGEDPFVIVLDEIKDPYNLGSIIRTAGAVGAHGVIIPKRRSAALTPLVAKASAGAVEYVPVARVVNIPKTLDELKENGLWIFGADVEGQDVYYDTDMKGPMALVIGSEGKGMNRLVKEKCDILVRISMNYGVSSLNAAVACAVIAYEIRRQREHGSN